MRILLAEDSAVGQILVKHGPRVLALQWQRIAAREAFRRQAITPRWPSLRPDECRAAAVPRAAC